MKSLLFVTILAIFYNSRLVLSLCVDGNEHKDMSGDFELYRRKRDNEDVTGPENPLWGNPCFYAEWTKPKLVPSDAEKLKMFGQRTTMMTIKSYNDLKNLQKRLAVAVWGKQDIESVFKPYEKVKWLQNSSIYKWFREEVLPDEKKIYDNISPSFLQTKMNRTQFDMASPRIHKAYKLILAALRELSEAGVCWDAINKDPKLRADLDIAVRTVRRGLCYFTDYVQASQKQPMHLDDSEFFYWGKDILKVWFRDTLNFLHYAGQIMEYQFRA